MSLYRVGKVWYVDITVGDQPRVRRSSGTTDKAQAQEYHDRLRAQLWRQDRLGERPAVSARWEDAASLWLLERPRQNEDKYRLRWLSKKLGNPPLSMLSVDSLERTLAPKATSPGSYNRYVGMVSAIMRIAKDRGWVQTAPALRRRREPRGRIRWLTRAQWRVLQRKLPPYLRQMARFALCTGLRENNVLNLAWDQVDLERAVCWIHADQAKGREAIGIPLNADAMRVLRIQRRLTKGCEWVFPGPRSAPLYKASNKSWYKAVKEAGLKGFRWHDLRHTWASWHVQAGTRLDVLQQLGGWKSIQMVMRYSHLAPEHLAAQAGNVKLR